MEAKTVFRYKMLSLLHAIIPNHVERGHCMEQVGLGGDSMPRSLCKMPDLALSDGWATQLLKGRPWTDDFS